MYSKPISNLQKKQTSQPFANPSTGSKDISLNTNTNNPQKTFCEFVVESFCFLFHLNKKGHKIGACNEYFGYLEGVNPCKSKHFFSFVYLRVK